MSLGRKTLRVIKAIGTCGESERLLKVNEKLRLEAKLYSQILSQISSVEKTVKDQLGEIGCWFRSAMKLLTAAEHLLQPMEKAYEQRNLMGSLAMPSLSALKIREINADYKSFIHIAAGAGAGAAAAAGVWGAVQLVGQASTGTAMLGLHGAAASSAGWAWLGGGSLATGGGGMALGHLILPGVGSIVAIAVGTVLSHKEVSKRKLELDKLVEANTRNRSALAQLNIVKADYDSGIDRIQGSTQRLHAAVKHARRKVMRFGFISQIWKVLRQLCGFNYYTPREQFELRQLEDAVTRFFASLKEKSAVATPYRS